MQVVNSHDTLLTKAQAMELLQMSETTLWRRCHEGKITRSKIGGKVFFKYSDLLQAAVAVTTQPMAEVAA
jgi:predicted DNA-binding transcriptional regulator AlpA